MTPKHHRAVHFRNVGLFTGLDSFASLEGRIAKLPGNKERGDAFEVFVEAYLATQPIRQAEEVWPNDTAPVGVLKQLNLPPTDYGADGVYRTRSGDLVAYQAKFRAGRTPLTFRELSTFFGITEQADQRVLFANVDRIADVAEDRSRFHWSRGADFDRLGSEDFARISAWLETGRIKHQPRQPLPHQTEALDDIRKGFEENDRATVVMACGTTKTQIAQWAAEQVEPRSVLVLVPSLALIDQTLHEWAKYTSWGERFRYLCVCSDPTVSKSADKIIIEQADADFRVSTDANEVGRFMKQTGDAVKVVFSTYHSARVVADGMKGRPPFDIGIFDEAHKTAGRQGTRDAFALHDENLPIVKRLFLTATPRHYDIRKRDKEGDAKLEFSMDDETTYGPVVHKLSFADAARQHIICGYKVVISVVDGPTVNRDLLKRGEVVIDGDPVRARQVANQIAVQETVERFGVRRIITFHSTVNAAESFANDGGDGIKSHLPDFKVFHVRGTQNAATRKGFLRGFKEAERGLITNARCLTEGVDIPAVDMVAFVSPKKSKVDIVQATGRAMRKAGPDKTTGYVLVPLFLEQNADESIEDALERSNFDEVANVLNAMRDHDEDLVDIIREMREELGRTGGYDESRFREKVEFLGPEISLAVLREAITARAVELLGVSWDERYGELIAYKDRFGDCNVPVEWKENPILGRWCSTQRYHFKSGKLPTERGELLEALGFIWDKYFAFWEEKYRKLVAYPPSYPRRRRWLARLHGRGRA